MSDWPGIRKTVLLPLAADIVERTHSTELKDYREKALSLCTDFSCWQPLHARLELKSTEFDRDYGPNPGVYLIGWFGSAGEPAGRADPLHERVVYVGITGRSLSQRLREFERGFEEFRATERRGFHPGGYRLAEASLSWEEDRVESWKQLHIAVLTTWLPDPPDPLLGRGYHHFVERLVILQKRLRRQAGPETRPHLLNKD